MPFQDTAESIAAKLHMHEANRAACAGIVALIIMAAVFAGKLAFEAATASQSAVEVSTSQEAAAQESAGARAAEQTGITVYVVGAVESPGVYELGQGARVNDAVAAAGGFASEADPASLNLARTLTDGEQVTVAALSEAQGEGTGQDSASSASASASGGLVNINRATAAELETISGIGPKTAAKIVADREANGPFASKEDLMRVSGIGEKKFASIEPCITVG